MVSFISNLDKIFCKKSFKSLALTAIMVSSFGLSANTANAQVGPGCDPAFMASMQAKALMEAQREVMIAQATIAKPDSVFSLGCFGNFTKDFEVKFTKGDNDYKYKDALDKYIRTAFNHTYGGGHYSGPNSSTNDKCEEMQDLWNAAREMNLEQPSSLLGTLQSFASYNRGVFPKAAPLPTAVFGAVGTAGSPLGIFYGAKVPLKSVNAAFDDVNLFAGVTSPVSQLTNKTCAAGIKTGIFLDGGSTKPEIICPNPGCVSDGATTPKCCPYTSGGGTCSP